MRAYKRVSFVLVRALAASLMACAFLVSGCESGPAEVNASLTTSGIPSGSRLRIRDAADIGFTSPVAEAISDAGYAWNDYVSNALSVYPGCGVRTLWHPGYDINILGAGGARDAETPIYAITDAIVIDRAHISRRTGSASVCDGREDGITEWGSITIQFYYEGVVHVAEYGHMERIEVQVGDVVRLGQYLGEMGTVGASSIDSHGRRQPAYHLHFEIRTMDHVCHDGVADGHCFDNAGLVRECTEHIDHRPSQYFCDLIANRRDVSRMYRNPIEFLVSRSMDQYASDTVGLSTLGAAVLPSVAAFPADTGTNPNPSSLMRQDISWLRGGSSISADDLRDALVREYRPSVWGGSPGYLVFPVNHGARHPYWVRSAIGARWHELATSSVDSSREACGMPITGEYLNCPGGVRPCASVRQDFQTCFITWQAGRSPELSGATAYPHVSSPGAYANAWDRTTPDTASTYEDDDAGYRFAEAYERNGASVDLGDPTGPVHVLLDSRYHVQVFSGGRHGRGLIVFDPENRIVSSNDPSRPLDRGAATFVEVAYDNVMTIARDEGGNPLSVVYGDRVQAHLIRTGFLDWYEANDGIRLVGAPLDDEYRWSRLDSRGRLVEDARQDFESGNCLIWHWEAPGSGLAYCGAIIGDACVGWETHSHGCPRVSSISIDGGSGRPVDLDLPPPATSGPDRGGGGSDDPDSGPPMSPDAGMPSGTSCTVDRDCPGYGASWRCQSGTCREADLDGDGYLGSDGDCNPDVPRIHRGAVETCDAIDEDCDGRVDEGFDLLSDPSNCGSCRNPCASGMCSGGVCVAPCSSHAEVCGNGLDDNCNGMTDEGCAPVCTPVAEVCNNRDEDCDTRIDESLSQSCSTACGSGTETCSAGRWVGCTAPVPGTETCDGRDQDCDGLVDDGVAPLACSTICGSGTRSCVGGSFGICSARTPTSETCNGLDDNCDGRIDEGCAPPIDPNLVRISLVSPRGLGCDAGWRIRLWLSDPSEDSPRGGTLEYRVTRADGHSAVTLWCDTGRTPQWYDFMSSSVNALGTGIFSELSMGGVDLRASTMICMDPCNPTSGPMPIIRWDPARRGTCPTSCGP